MPISTDSASSESVDSADTSLTSWPDQTEPWRFRSLEEARRLLPNLLCRHDVPRHFRIEVDIPGFSRLYAISSASDQQAWTSLPARSSELPPASKPPMLFQPPQSSSEEPITTADSAGLPLRYEQPPVPVTPEMIRADLARLALTESVRQSATLFPKSKENRVTVDVRGTAELAEAMVDKLVELGRLTIDS